MTEDILIDIRGLYDGWAVKFTPSTKKFEWRGFILEKTTEEYRIEFEKDILKEFENEEA